MTPWIEPIVLWLADFYLVATILLTVVAAVFAVVKQPARRMAVAWGTLLGLLVAAVLCQSASRPRLALRHLLSKHDGKAAKIQTSKISLPLVPILTETAPPRAAEPERFEPRRRPVEQSAAFMPLSIASAAKEPRPAAPGRLAVGGVVLSFLAGTLLMGAWLSVGVFRAARLVRQSEPPSGTCLDALRTIVGPSSRPPRLGVNKRLLMPVAAGALRPAILLPEQFAQPGRAHELRAVLAHEWAHIKNGDLWLLAVDRLLLALLWAHPLYWWTRRRLRADQELLADAAAASRIGAADYAALLVTWTRQLAAQRGPAVSTAVGIWERPAGLAPRITALLDHSDATILRTSGRTRIGVATAMTFCTLFACLFSLRPTRTELANAQDQAANEQSRDAKIQPQKGAPSKPTKLDKPLSSGVAVTPKIVDYHLAKDEVGGLCMDRDENRIAGVETFLFIEHWEQRNNFSHRLVGHISTNDAGQFVFAHVPDLERGHERYLRGHERYLIVARRPGRATTAGYLNQRHDWLDLKIGEAVSIKGTVRDVRGKPIAGALIRTIVNGWILLPETVQSTRSDTDGKFEFDDLGWGWMCTVSQPGYLNGGASSRTKKNPVAVVLRKEAIIEGQVVDGETGQPVAGVLVVLRTLGFDPGRFAPRFRSDFQAKTDSSGHYTIGSLWGGQFNLSFRGGLPGRAVAPFDVFQVPRGKTVQAPLVRLAKGGIVTGRLIDNTTGQPESVDAAEALSIGVKNPSDPGGAPLVQNVHVRDDGTFEVWLPPGKNSIYIAGGPFFSIGDVPKGIGHDVREIDVKAGQDYTVEFRVLRITPMRQRTANDR